MTTAQKVMDLIAEQPDLTTRQVAERLGCMPEYVRATISRRAAGLTKIRRKPGANSTWAPGEIAQLINLRDVDCLTWKEISKEMGRPLGTCSYQYGQYEDANIAPKRDPAEGMRRVPEHLVEDARRRYLAERSITTAFFGDPPKGWSALEKKQGTFA